VCYVTTNPAHGLVKEHIRAGGRAVVLEESIGGHMITLFDNGAHMPLLWTHVIPATLEGRAMHNVQNALFAAGVAYSLGVSLDDIRHGLRTFDTTYFQAPGRMNIFDEHPFRVILDYGHNPAAVEAMVALCGRLEPKGRRLVVVAAPGDRRDEDVVAIARLCAGHFDRYVCRRDDNPRGRGASEIPQMLRDALVGAGVPAEHVDVIPDEREAVSAVLRRAQRDDLVLVFGDAIARTWKQIVEFKPEEHAPPPADAPGPGSSLPALGRRQPIEVFAEEGSIVRDERGVRLARRPETLDD